MADGERENPREIVPRRIVLLGASNLTRGISTVVETAQAIWGSPLEVLAALGHGRSYGLRSRVLGRELPGITSCGLWNELGARPAAESAALVTDIGNDLLYGASVSSILGWVGEILDRLAAVRARTVMTLLPLSSVEALSAWRFAIVRAVTFPKCRTRLEELLLQARELNAGLKHLSEEYHIHLIESRAAWYGFDAIHIRLRHWRTAWAEILAPWSDAAASQSRARGSLTRWLYLRSLPPLERKLFGRERRAAQPAGRLRDGTTIALY